MHMVLKAEITPKWSDIIMGFSDDIASEARGKASLVLSLKSGFCH